MRLDLPEGAGFLHPRMLGLDFPIHSREELLTIGRIANRIKAPESKILTKDGETKAEVERKIRELQAQLDCLK